MQQAVSPEAAAGSTVLTNLEAGVLRITLNRAAKRNALDRPTLAALAGAFASRTSDDAVKLVVLTGAGERSFAAGGDLNDLASVRTRSDAAAMSTEARSALDSIRRCPIPVVAALNGDALGGGAELAAACDFRVAAERARIGFVQGRLAITTAWGGGIDLAAIVGPARALELLCRFEVLNAGEALAIGLVNKAAEPGQSLEEAVEDFIRPMLTLPRQVLAAFKALNSAVRRGAPRAELESLETNGFAEAWISDAHWRAADAVLKKGAR